MGVGPKLSVVHHFGALSEAFWSIFRYRVYVIWPKVCNGERPFSGARRAKLQDLPDSCNPVWAAASFLGSFWGVSHFAGFVNYKILRFLVVSCNG